MGHSPLPFSSEQQQQQQPQPESDSHSTQSRLIRRPPPSFFSSIDGQHRASKRRLLRQPPPAPRGPFTLPIYFDHTPTPTGELSRSSTEVSEQTDSSDQTSPAFAVDLPEDMLAEIMGRPRSDSSGSIGDLTLWNGLPRSLAPHLPNPSSLSKGTKVVRCDTAEHTDSPPLAQAIKRSTSAPASRSKGHHIQATAAPPTAHTGAAPVSEKRGIRSGLRHETTEKAIKGGKEPEKNGTESKGAKDRSCKCKGRRKCLTCRGCTGNHCDCETCSCEACSSREKQRAVRETNHRDKVAREQELAEEQDRILEKARQRLSARSTALSTRSRSPFMSTSNTKLSSLRPLYVKGLKLSAEEAQDTAPRTPTKDDLSLSSSASEQFQEHGEELGALDDSAESIVHVHGKEQDIPFDWHSPSWYRRLGVNLKASVQDLEDRFELASRLLKGEEARTKVREAYVGLLRLHGEEQEA